MQIHEIVDLNTILCIYTATSAALKQLKETPNQVSQRFLTKFWLILYSPSTTTSKQWKEKIHV